MPRVGIEAEMAWVVSLALFLRYVPRGVEGDSTAVECNSTPWAGNTKGNLMWTIDIAIALGAWLILMLSMTSAVYQRRS
ncbi:MAG TPA: hypothetical protein VIY86_14780 [Pirellulaceae bacterium]